MTARSSRAGRDRRAVLIGQGRADGASYGDDHPLAIPRVPLTLELIGAYDALAPSELLAARQATVEELSRFHTRDYLSAFRAAEARGGVTAAERERFGLGNRENPYFTDFYKLVTTAAGGSIQGAEQLLAGRVAFNPAGGMHHAAPDQARGFCFINDCVLAIRRLRREGLRVLYLDIDAHYGDGVAAACQEDSEVLTLSLHMDTAYAYPFVGGQAEERGAHGTWINVPLPRGTHDAEYHWLFDRIWSPTLQRFRPDAVVLQAGADALFFDPLGALELTTQGLLAVVQRVIETAPRHPDGTPRLLVVGGGGYHPLGVARFWTGLWGLLSGRELPDALPTEGAELLRSIDWDLDSDEPLFADLLSSRIDRPRPSPVRDPAHLERLLSAINLGHSPYRD